MLSQLGLITFTLRNHIIPTSSLFLISRNQLSGLCIVHLLIQWCWDRSPLVLINHPVFEWLSAWVDSRWDYCWCLLMVRLSFHYNTLLLSWHRIFSIYLWVHDFVSILKILRTSCLSGIVNVLGLPRSPLKMLNKSIYANFFKAFKVLCPKFNQIIWAVS